MGISLDERMKTYEAVPKHYLTRRIPVIIRLDGNAFHTFTKEFIKPFDHALMRAMEDTMEYLCIHIPGCVLGYKQSDEITLVLIDYQNLETDAWFNYSVEKLCSITASMATYAFDRFFRFEASTWLEYCQKQLKPYSSAELTNYPKYLTPDGIPISRMDIFHQFARYSYNIDQGAFFDARVFNVPKDEVMNCLVWRQQDARRNSIQMVGQYNFSSKELHGKSTEDIIEMLKKERSIDWNDFASECKYGVCCIKRKVHVEPDSSNEKAKPTDRLKWVIDREIPIFNEQPNYIEDLIFVGGTE